MPFAAEIPKKKKPTYFDNYSGFADSPALSVQGGLQWDPFQGRKTDFARMSMLWLLVLRGSSMRRYEFLSWRTTRSRVLSVAAGALVSIAAASMVSAVQAAVVNLGSFSGEFVTVGDPGNTADTIGAGYGAVSQTFDIMKFEFTNQQYVQFLNSVDANGNQTNEIYNASMGSVAWGGISFTSGAATGSKYAVRTNMGNKPVNSVTWFDAARVSNWLHNGATSTSSMESGAYTLNNAFTGNAVALNTGARFFIPSENQWYKAAYYKGGSTTAGYWAYATQSNSVPTSVSAIGGNGGTGNGSAGNSGNFANYNRGADWNGQDGNVTTVGTNGGPSAYGAFDMSGNVREWNDLNSSSSSSRGVRGGGWGTSSSLLSSSTRSNVDPSNEDIIIGFRVASLSSDAVVPEPSMMVIGMVFGLGGLAAKRRLKK
jgi:formylglycine-generating enzyme required for sulfatase activity